MTRCVRKVRPADVTLLDFVNDFDAITHSTVMWKLKKYRLENGIARWTEKQLDLWAQSVVPIWLAAIYETNCLMSSLATCLVMSYHQPDGNKPSANL